MRATFTKEQEALLEALEAWFRKLDARQRKDRGLPIKAAGAHAIRDFNLVQSMYAQN